MLDGHVQHRPDHDPAGALAVRESLKLCFQSACDEQGRY